MANVGWFSKEKIMPAGLNNTTLLDLPLPVEGYFDGSWGDLVNYSLTNYLDIAIAGTSTFTGDASLLE